MINCKDDDRRSTYGNEKFDFPYYTFRSRRSKNRYGKFFINFTPAISDKAVKEIRAEIRRWLQYYGRLYRSALYPPIGNWTEHWPDGLIGSTKCCADICVGRLIGWGVYRNAIRSYRRTGRWVCGEAPWREAYELRGSRTVL